MIVRDATTSDHMIVRDATATRQRKPLPPGQSLILSPTLGLLTRNTSPRNPGEKLKEKGSEIIRALQYGEDYFTTELRAIATNE